MKFLIPGLTAILGFALGIIISTEKESISSNNQPGSTGLPSLLSGSPNEVGSPNRPADPETRASTTRDTMHQLMELAPSSHFEGSNRPLYDAIDRLSAAALRDLARTLETMDLGANHPKVFSISIAIFTRWAQLKPTEAWEATLELKNLNLQTRAIETVLQQIASQHPQQAKSMIDRLTNPQQREKAFSALVKGTASKDSNVAFEILEERNQGDPWHYGYLFTQWAQEDPAAAIARVADVKIQRNRHRA
ncbi:MAG: hypothetical protein AAF514_20265, partial [Verrucomicrobiota bacterium]